MELANAKQGAEVIVVLKKLTKKISTISNIADDGDDDEVRKLLPNRTVPQLDAFDHKYASDKIFKAKVVRSFYQKFYLCIESILTTD